MTWLNFGPKIVSLLLLLTLAGCASSGSTSKSDGDTKEMTLRQHLERISGVNLQGRQENTRVSIRASGSLTNNRGKQPLFVVDGRKMGRSFYRISRYLNPGQIISVEVLSGSGANMYGNQGGQGVIKIKTTKNR